MNGPASLRLLTAFLVGAVTACCVMAGGSSPATGPGRAAADGPPIPGAAFWEMPIWSDGQAEVNLYEATEVRYGVPRPVAEAVMIVVKEDHRSDEMVKADDAALADLPAIKMIWSAEVPTGIYAYRQTASIFLDRRTGRPFRETFSSQEWCGSTFKDLRSDSGGWNYRWTSYFDGEGDDAREVAPSGAMPADILPLLIRSLVASGETGPLRLDLLPTLWSNRVRPTGFAPAQATLRIAGVETVEVPAGRIEAIRFEVAGSDGATLLFVERSFPHRLVRLEKPDGTVWRLRKSFRAAYWSEHDPGDETLREGTGLDP